ncbi:MAG: SPFH domain-containing protein [Phycisphaeraceae bacterium]|nr:SPFH domain-containing protein [Phycisphaeraceae bacterium]
MSIWDRLKKELIDIIQYLDDTNNTLVYRFERFQNEIKWGAKLVVREGQAAVFINEGKLADVFGPGTYTLDTKNLPILATLKGWKYGFESPFKAEVYFISTRQFTDLKWGTMNPVIVRDPEFGPIRLRAFGTYAIRVKDPATFIREIVGTDGRFTTDEIVNQLRNVIVSHLGDALGESKIGVVDMSARYREMGEFLTLEMRPWFEGIGLDLTTMLVENISLPPEVEQALDKRSSMGVIGNVEQYAKFQAADALRDAAKNPGAAGMMVGMGVGNVLGGQMAGVAAGSASGGTPPTPPPIPAVAFFVAINNQQAGPFDASALRAKVAGGELRPETLVWKQGMASWAPAREVPELAAVLNSAPPPLPG